MVTGTRADFGLMYWIMKEIEAHATLALQVAVTGSHLSPAFGETWREIETEGFAIDARIDMLALGDDHLAMAKSTGVGTAGFADAFEELHPDVVLVPGDRFEILAAAQAAMLMRIPLAHIHGGEVTEGAVDESIRHAVTKMASLHFTAAEPYRQRVIQLGENPAHVHTVGAPGLDNLERLALMDRAELEQNLGAPLGQPLFLVTYHPVTLARRPPVEPLKQLFDALDHFSDAHILITGANADAGGAAINREIETFAKARSHRITHIISLGRVRYLSALVLADVVIGNSSSGLIEAPSAGTPTVNIGDRQKGRLEAVSVISCQEESGTIRDAITQALEEKTQRLAKEDSNNLYGKRGEVARNTVSVLAGVDLGALASKPFFDLPQ